MKTKNQIKWRTEVTYVDQETGEALIANDIKIGRYTVVYKKVTNKRLSLYVGIKYIRHECRKSNQCEIWEP